VRAGGWAHAAGAALLLAVALAWLIPAMAIGGAAYSRDLLGQKSLGYVVNSWRHAEPFYYFIQWAPVLVLPWSLLLPLPIYAAVRDRREDDARPPFFTVVWCAATVAFFSCISGKRFGYMLPIAPAVGMLVGWYLSGGLAQRHPRCQAAGPWLMRATLGAFGAVLAGLMALTFLPARWAALTGADSGAFGARWQAQSLVLLLLPLGCCIAGCVWAGKRLRRAAVLLVLAVALGSLWFDLSLASPMNATKSSRAFCEEMKPYLATTSKLRFYSADFSGAVNLYTGRVSIPAIWGGRQLREALRDPETLVLSDLKRFGDVLSEAELERYTVFRGTVGGRRMLLLRGRAPSAAQPAPAGP
jgi:4-amino-4-deoxy-L-arabinose transferase-like glycosyltransferase